MNSRDRPIAERTRTVPRIAVLKAQNYAEWKPVRDRGEAAGNLGPYSVDRLEEHGFEVAYSDATFEWPWANPIVERGLGRLGRSFPELRGIHNALANRRLISRADITLGIFEDQGTFAAFAAGHPLLPASPRKMALVVCWLAEQAQHADERTIRGYRRVLAGADLVVFFSQNQAEVFQHTLGVDPERLLAVPFGIDAQFFAEVTPRDDGYVLAVGGDGSRDHELLVEAVRGIDIPTRIFTPNLNVAELPANVTWTPEVINHVAYREVLAGAKMVIIPTKGTTYPGGQTVLLEAMASSKPVIVTSSDAMDDYVTDGVTGLLVARGDARALGHAIERLAGDGELRASLARNALDAVHKDFNQGAMWGRVAPRLHDLVAPPTTPSRRRCWR